jgi:hypothetical protein
LPYTGKKILNTVLVQGACPQKLKTADYAICNSPHNPLTAFIDYIHPSLNGIESFTSPEILSTNFQLLIFLTMSLQNNTWALEADRGRLKGLHIFILPLLQNESHNRSTIPINSAVMMASACNKIATTTHGLYNCGHSVA